ncbi:hypothetical protein TanjilG_10624 [Lupinus angustifolius]|uniref:Uncharacterized protein n=1 Tax=Lupinus angustifolius TaxID=3871 RepID=A0A4P1RVK9_LUPAN|nr:hypothetical protein TanjilG_10624 [Lupinus angustifolius]
MGGGEGCFWGFPMNESKESEDDMVRWFVVVSDLDSYFHGGNRNKVGIWLSHFIGS